MSHTAIYFLFFIIILNCTALGGEVKDIYFGGVFEDFFTEEATDEPVTEAQVFKTAIKSVNVELNVTNLLFKGLTETVYNHLKGPFKAKLTTCSLLEQQALVIFGPKNHEDMNIVQSICDSKDIAHVITRWVYNPVDYRSTINFYPHFSYVTAAYFNILQLLGWKSFTLFYENNESLLRMAELLDITKNAGIVVVVRQLDEFDNGTYRITLKEAVQSGETRYVIDCSTDVLEEVLRQVQQVGLLTNQYCFLITNMDLPFIDLHPFKYSGANITGIRIFNRDSEVAANKTFSVNGMKTETALIADAVYVLAKTISNKLSFEEMQLDNVGCDSLKSSRLGDTISNHVKTSKDIGLTGPIEFDRSGFRSNFNLDVISVTEKGVMEIGTWNESKGLVLTHSKYPTLIEDSGSLRNKTFRVITCLTDPYCMLKETSVQLFGNDRFEGFAIDLIHELSLMEGFNYTFLIREDKSNGVKDKLTLHWSGMIGDVIDNVADLAITDLTITADREQAVDFTSPFMSLGISILAQKPGNAPPSFFSFADPFALDTWIMLGLAYAFVSISLFIMARLCQEEWTNPYPCIEEPEFLFNQFSLQNAGWFAAGALMQQGTELGPIAISTRMVSGMWWFFSLIIAASYTANLAAFLATENPINLFTDLPSLVANREKHEIKMGAKKGGATESFFASKEDYISTQVADYMKNNENDMVTENREGVLKAETETYAFFMESTSIEYEIQRHCDLQQYGKLLDDKGYGIAMRKNSTYRTTLSTAILKLQASGKLDLLKRKWWEEKRGGGQCAAGDGDESTPPLGVQNIEGVFYVTIGGVILAVIIVIVQMLLHMYNVSKKARITFKEALKMEKDAFLDFNSDVKPVSREKSASRSKSKSSRGSEIGNNNLTAPAPQYGFIPTITKEKLED